MGEEVEVEDYKYLCSPKQQTVLEMFLKQKKWEQDRFYMSQKTLNNQTLHQWILALRVRQKEGTTGSKSFWF